ncbi:MAG: acyl-CoA dehydrogenase family protein [Gammaproteobacteria bacterium]|nr:acyl-CoA dehydrogenase family protein [Gammaproteobacteria bacterium]
MNLQLSPADARFRDEVRTFLDAALDDDLRRGADRCGSLFQDYATNIRWHRILHQQGWVAPSWPEQFGGPGWSVVQRYLFQAECAAAGAPALAPMGLGMCGPVLMGYGTAEQQAFYLPRILSGEDYWCQGYSEPGSGSDLASLGLRALRDGDHYVLNGTKIWTTHAQHANRMFLLVRTDAGGRPQAGITFLLMDMDTPGISVEPIIFSSGDHEVNTVFFEDVRVPVANRVGDENDGWTVAKYLLEFERGGGGAARLEALLVRIRRMAAATDASGHRLLDDPDFSSRLEALAINLDAVRMSEFRILSALSQGGNPGPASSILKTSTAALNQQLTELALEVAGLWALPHQPEARQPEAQTAPVGPEAALTATARYLNTRAVSIAGGTDEVQRNIVAKLVLGL